MAYALRYYKEFTHADGKVIRLEIHKKDSTTAAVEIGAVVQGLSLQIQGQQGDIDTPIVKTSLSMTFVDAGDIENGQKNGFWEEFYTPDSVLWKVLVKAKKAGETAFTTIWGGYVTPDSFSESLTYRGSVNIIARDNIGHMQDFPFDAEGDEDGMISLYDLVNTAWAKIESPMSLMWDGGHWMQCEGVNGYNTLMNVSAFEGMSWYEAVEKALYSYGGVMRYIGGNEVLVTTLRYMPTFGRNIDRLPRIEPTFITGATRELVPAVKRVEESVKYDLNKDYQQKIDLIDFSGNVYDVQTDWGTVDDIAWGLMVTSPMAPFGWYNEVPYKTLAFNPKAYEIDDTISESDREDIHGNTCILTGTKDDDTYSLSYAMTVGPEDFAINIKFGRFLTRWTNLAGEHSLGFPTNFFGAEYKVRFAVKVVSNGITSYLAQNGEWVEEQATQQVTVTGDSMSVNVPLSGVFTGKVQVSFVFLNIDTGDDAVRILQILGISLSDISTKPMLETNTVNTNYQEGNNVVLSRDPEIGPAYNTVALPAFIKNGIFRREGNQILPAYKWGWSGSTPQQMAVYNHLQLLAYYAKPNNLISGTIVNADVTDIACIYEWHHADHILVSGNLNLLNGHIEGAMLREYARYEYLWADVEGAGFPETEQASTTNVEGGASAGGSSSTYTNNTTVNIGSGSSGTGASQLNDLSDVDTTGVVAQSVLYYNGTSWVDMSIHTLLNPYVKGDELNRLLDEINAEIEKRALDSDLETLALTVGDNTTNIRNLKDSVYTKDDLATYKAWWDDLMGLIVKEGSDIKINGNLIVAGDTSTGGTGSNPEVAGTLTGIKVNGETYGKPVNGILTIPDYPTSLEWSAINGKPTKLSEFLNDSGFITSAALVGYATQSWVEGKGYITGITLTGDDYISVNGYQLSLAIDAQGGLENTGQGLGVANLRNSLTFGSKTFDGSAAQTITASDLGALTSHQSVVNTGNTLSFGSAIIIGSVGGTNLTAALPSVASVKTSLGLGSLAYLNSLALADVPDLSSKYLSTAGGTITGNLTLVRNPSVMAFMRNSSTLLGYLGFNSSGEPIMYASDGATTNTLLHSGNIGSYAMTRNSVSYQNAVNDCGYGLSQRGWPYNGPFISFGSDASYKVVLHYPYGLSALRCKVFNNSTEGSDWKTIAFTDSDISGYSAGLKHSSGTIGAVVNSSGNVLIGTTTDSTSKLQVSGNIDSFGDGNYSGVIGLNRKSAAGGRYNTAYGGWQIHNYLGTLQFYCETKSGGGDNRMVITEGGNVGLGTTNPAYKLDVVGTVNAQAFQYKIASESYARFGITYSNNTAYFQASKGSSVAGNIYICGESVNALETFKVKATTSSFTGTLTVSGLTTINGNLVVAGDISA